MQAATGPQRAANQPRPGWVGDGVPSKQSPQDRQRRASATPSVQRRRLQHSVQAAAEIGHSKVGSSEPERGAGAGSQPADVWQEMVQQAQEQVAAQQASGLAQAYPLDKTRQLVETAMLAAVAGLAYTVGTLIKLESYLAYILPLPVVLAALRSGPVPAVKTLTTTFLLLLILMGPVRATTYLLIYGLLSLSLGVCWALRLPWLVSIPLGALARIAGYLAYIALSSWLTNENLLVLMLNNVYALLDQLSAVLGTTGSPPLMAVAIVLCSLLFVNSIMYVALSHVLYAIILNSMGLRLHRAPKFVERLLAQMPTSA